MANIIKTSVGGAGTRPVTEIVLTSTNDLTYEPGAGHVLILRNPTAASIDCVLRGADSTTVNFPGAPFISVAGGYSTPVPAGAVRAIPLDTVAAYLKGPVTVTGAGLVAVLMRGVNGRGARSIFNDPPAAVPGEIVIPTAPVPFAAGDWSLATGLEANQLVVNIDSLPANGGSPITAIQYSANGGTWTALPGGAGTGPRTLTMPAAGTSYSIRLRAVNAVGNSTPGDTKTASSGAETPVFRPEYLGAVATGGRIATTASTTNKQHNSRSHHVAREAITGLRVEFPAWLWARKVPSTSGGSLTQYREHAAGSPITYRAAIEYPAGTFTQLLFNGAASAVVPGGDSVLSDMATVSIPNGASFWIRTYATATWGIIFEDGDSGITTVIDRANGEAMEFAASGLTDKTTSGTITDSGAASGPIFRPTAIVAMTRQPTFLFTGDSKAWGYGDTPTAGGDAGELERLIGPNYGYINAGSSGDWLDTFRDFGTRRAALQQYVSHVVVQAAINSLRSGGAGQAKTAAAVLAEQQQVLALFPTKGRIVTTTAPQAASSNNYADQAGQTVNANSAQIIAFNDAIRAGVANSIGHIDLADAAEPTRNAGKWKTDGTARAFTTDGLHATPLGYSQVNALTLPSLTYVAP